MKKITALILAILTLTSLRIQATADNDVYKNVFDNYDVGDYVYLGSFEQDGNLDNGPEPIRWQVVERFSNCIKVVSAEVLDARPFNEGSCTWETSAIRGWLNGEFYENAFEDWEKYLIDLAFVHNRAYGNGSDANDTYDNVILLDYKEVTTYFGSQNGSRRLAYPTAWMRTQGESRKYAMYVGSLGNIDKDGNPVNWQQGGVRPCIHISTLRNASEFYHRTEGTSDYIYCPECGKKLETDSNFCMYCGHKLK